MHSMDIDTSDEKENTLAMASPKTDAPLDQPTGMEDLQSGLTKEKVNEVQEEQPSLRLKTDKSCDECQEKGIKCTHVEDTNIAPRREYAPDSDDDSSVLSDVPSPVLSRASVSEKNRRKSTDRATERGDEMDVNSAEPEKEEEPKFPSNPDGVQEDDALPPSRTHTRSPSPSSSIKLAVDKEEAKVDTPNPDSSKAADNAPDSISSGSAGAPLLTPGSGVGSVSNRALSPIPSIETELNPVEPGPQPAAEPEPDPVVELTGDEEEALMTLIAELSTVPAAVARAAVREHALKCLVGSKADEIIFMDAIFNQASDDVIRKFIDSNATRMLEVANKHCKPFLDRAVEIRVEDIDGKKLAGYLARAERLGFEEQDDIDGESALPVERNNVQVISDPSDNDGDQRMQYMQPPAGEIHGTWQQPPPGYMHNPAYPSPYYVQQNQGHPPGMKICHKCGAAFKQNAGLRYHLEKDVCKKAGVPQGPVMARCESCGKEFRSPGGYHYHMTNNVCGVRNSASPQPEGQAQNDQDAALTGQQPQAKEEEKVAAAAPPVVNQTPVQAALPHMFQNTQQQPYQGPYQNPPPQEHIQRPPMPDRIVPSMNGTPQPTAASGEQIVNTNGLLTPAQAQKLNEDLRAEDIKYAQQLKNIDPALQGAALDLEVKRLKAGMSTRKSNLRRKHGIFVRKTDKVAANAVRNEDGSIDIAPAGKTIVSGAGFAPVNHRPEAPAASPAPQRASRGPESPPSGMPDAKRRRVSERPQQHPQQHPQPQPQPMAPSPYGQGPMGYPPNYNMHPGSYDPRQPPHMTQGPYQQYSMSPYSQPSPYQQQPPMHPPYGQPPGYQMNTIIRAPGAPVPTQSPSPAIQGPQGPGYFPPSGFVSVNQPPPPAPPAGYMLVASPAPQQHYPVQNGQPHGHPRAVSATSERGGDCRGSSSGPVENGKSRPKVPTDNAEKVWKAKQRDWVVQTGPQEAFKRMERNGKEGSQEQDGEPKKEKIMKKKEKTEFLVMDSDDEDATDEDESAKRPSNAANGQGKENETAEDKVERERRELSTSSELSDLDESALMGAGEGGEPVIVQRASEDNAPQEAPKPARKKPGPKPKPKNQPPPAPQTSGFQAVNATRYLHNPGVDDYDSDEITNARPPAKKPAPSRAPAPARHQQSDGGNDEDLEPGNEILQVASEDEMQVDTPPSRRRAAVPAASSSAPPPGSSSNGGAPGSAGAPGQPKKRLGRPVGWKKGMGGYRELLDAGVVHHNPEGTPNSRRRAEKRAAERALRRQTEGDGDAGGESSGAGGSRAAGGRQSMG